MTRLLIFTALPVLLLTVSVFAAGHPKLIVPEVSVFAKIPFGLAQGSIKPYEVGQPGDGVPTSFTFDKDGKLHLLLPHTREIIVLSSNGEFENLVELRSKEGRKLHKKSFMYDFDFDDKGNYLILDRSGGWIARFDPTGRNLGIFGQNVGADRMFIDHDGNIVVRDSAEGVLNIFDPEGSFIGEVKGPYLSPEVGRNGKFIRNRIINFHRAFIWYREAGRKLPSLFAVINEYKPKSKIYQAETLGFDSSDRLHILTTEKAEAYSSYVYRYLPNGKADAIFKVKPNMERVAEIPRFFRLMSDGRLVTFRITATNYEILVYDLNTN